jgi:hypothetical protein
MYSRRQFLICAGVALLPICFQGPAKFNVHPAANTPMGFQAVELDTLAAIMDEMIPAGDGMPAASLAGGPQYLQYLGWQYSVIQQEIGNFLRKVTQTSSDMFRQDFRKLSPRQRVQILASIEKSESPLTSACRRYRSLRKAVPSKGLEGDRYFLRTGSFSGSPGAGREVTPIEPEAIEALQAKGIPLEPGEAPRNLVTRGPTQSLGGAYVSGGRVAAVWR